MTKPYRLNWQEMNEFRSDQLAMILKLVDDLGDVASLSIMGMKFCLVTDPDLIRDLLIKHPRQLHRDPFTTRILGRIMGTGVFIAEDEAWQRQRKLVQPVFHAKRIDQFADQFADYADQMCQGWQPGESRQLNQDMMQLTLRIICKTMFGIDVDGISGQIGKLMQTVLVEAEAQLRHGIPIPTWLPTPGNRRQKRALNDIHNLLMEIIHKRQVELVDVPEESAEASRDLLSMLLMAKDEAGEKMSDQQVLHECMTLFLAGHETTAVALTWTWYQLLQCPDILNRVKDEVSQALGHEQMSYERLAEMPYLTQVIKESLRLYPPAAAFARTPTESFESNGHHFEPGTMLLISIYALHRQEKFYPEPMLFRPERFAEEVEQPPRYAYIPFGAGSRTCIGNAFAMLEMQVILATMVQSLNLSLVPNQDIVPETLVTLRPKGGVKVFVDQVIQPMQAS